MAYKNYQDKLKHNHEYWPTYYLKNKDKILAKNRKWSKDNKPWQKKLK